MIPLSFLLHQILFNHEETGKPFFSIYVLVTLKHSSALVQKCQIHIIECQIRVKLAAFDVYVYEFMCVLGAE